MDVDAVLLSVQERDKWRRRLALLERSLGEVRDTRTRTLQRLRRIKRELSRLTAYSDAVLDATRRRPAGTSSHATTESRLPAR